MADLSAMYMDLAEKVGNAPYQGALRMQQIMDNQLAYQKAREDMEAQRGLRALFTQNPNATPEEVSRFSPQLGMEMNKYAQEAQERTGRMRKTQNEISEQEMKIFSVAGAQVAEKYAPAAMSGQMTPQMLSQFHNEIGNTLMQIEQQYGIRPPPGMDVSRLDPMGVLSRAAPFYKSPVIENMMAIDKEQMISQIDPRRTPEQAYGGVEMGQYGPKIKPPLPRQLRGTGVGGAPAAQLPEGYERATAEDIPAIQQAYDNATDLNEKQQIGALLNQLKQQAQPAGSQFVTPQQESQLRMEEKQQEKELETKKQLDVEKGKQTIQEQASAKKATTAYDMLPDPDRIRNLIKGSISGDTEYWANRLGGVVGKSLESGDITGALKVIEGQMADTVAMFPGAQSDKELEARMKTIGNPSGEISADTRLRAFDEWLTRMKKYAAQHADYDDTTLIDMVKSDKLTADQAMQIRKRRMSGGR